MKFFKLLIILSSTLFYNSCSIKPEPIIYGKDNCNYCKMTITDRHFGTELLTNKGKIYKFDELSCMLSFVTEQEIDTSKIKGMYISDYCGKNTLFNKNVMFYMHSDSLKSPMGGNFASFSEKDSMQSYISKVSGKALPWAEVVNSSVEE